MENSRFIDVIALWN